MKVRIPKDWSVQMALLEGDAEVGAGDLAVGFSLDHSRSPGSTGLTSLPSSTFGRLVSHLRCQQKLTREQLADRLRVERNELRALEDDPEHTPHLRTVYQIARHFNLKISLLLQLAGLTEPSDTEFTERAVRFAANADLSSEFSDEQRAVLEALISELNERR